MGLSREMKDIAKAEVVVSNPWEKQKAKAYIEKYGCPPQGYDHLVEISKGWLKAGVGFLLTSVFTAVASNVLGDNGVGSAVSILSYALAGFSGFCFYGANMNISDLKNGDYLRGIQKKPTP